MSLPYSEFQTDQNSNKKRQPTLGKPKITATDNFQAQIADETVEKQKRMNKLNELLTSATTTDDNSTMGNFQPLQHPALNAKLDYETGENPSLIKYSPVLNNPMVQEEPKYGNYRQIYEKPMTFVEQGKKPYYSSMGLSSSSSEMDKIMEKLNYMTHLLEEQKNERTNNIGEEFVLYTFLGVFIIYVVDSFSRSGKYVR